MRELNEGPPLNAGFLRKHVIKSNSFPYQAKLNQFSKRMGRAQSAPSKAKKRSGRVPGSCSHLCVGRNEEFIGHHETQGGVRSKLSGKFFKRLFRVIQESSWDEKKKWFYWTKVIVKVQQMENAVLVWCRWKGRKSGTIKDPQTVFLFKWISLRGF